MTKKRFIQSRHLCIDRVKKRRTEYWDTLIDWSNELNEEKLLLEKENEQLKSAIKDCIRISESNRALSPMRLKSIFYHFEL